jgi:hypothetical protein
MADRLVNTREEGFALRRSGAGVLFYVVATRATNG